MTDRRSFLKLLGAALGCAALPGAVVEAAERCTTQADELSLLDAVLGRRESYAVRSVSLDAWAQTFFREYVRESRHWIAGRDQAKSTQADSPLILPAQAWSAPIHVVTK